MREPDIQRCLAYADVVHGAPGRGGAGPRPEANVVACAMDAESQASDRTPR